MNKVIEILMRRDGIDYIEAREIFMEVKQMISEALVYGNNHDTIEDILIDELGLEIDYMIYFL